MSITYRANGQPLTLAYVEAKLAQRTHPKPACIRYADADKQKAQKVLARIVAATAASSVARVTPVIGSCDE